MILTPFKFIKDNTGKWVADFFGSVKIKADKIFASISPDKAESIIEGYNNALLKGKNAAEDFLNTNDETISSMKKWLKETSDSERTVENFTVAQKKAAIAIKNAGMASKAAAVFFRALQTAINMGIFVLISLAVNGVIDAITHLINKQKEEAQALADAIQAYEEASSSIENYRNQILELKKSLDSGNLSAEESYNVRQQILSIQDEIIKKYGDEAGAIDLLAAKVDKVNEAFDILAQNEAQEFLDKNRQAIQDAVKYFQQSNQEILSSRIVTNSALQVGLKDFNDIISSVGGKFLETWEGTSIGISLTGTIDQNIESLTKLEKELDKYYDKVKDDTKIPQSSRDALNEFINDISNRLKSLTNDETYKQFKTSYDKMIESIALTKYHDYYRKVLDIQKEYTDAIAKNDKEAASKAADELQKALADAISKVGTNSEYGKDLTKWFSETLNGSFNKAIAKNNFRKLLSNPFGVGGYEAIPLQSALEKIKGTTVDSADLTEEQIDAFDLLAESAENAGLSIDDLNEILVDLGYRLPTQETEDFAKSIHDLLNDDELSSQLKKDIDILNDWRSNHEDVTAALENLSKMSGLSADQITSNLDLITAYVNGDAEAFRKALSAQLELFGLHPDTSGIKNAIQDLINKANAGSDSAIKYAMILHALGKVKVTYITDQFGNKIAKFELDDSAFKDIKVKGGGGGGGGSRTDKTIGAFEKRKRELDHQLAMDLISEEEYYKKLQALADKYYKGKKKYLKEYQQVQEEVYKYEKQHTIDLIDQQIKINETLRDSVDVGSSDWNKYNDKIIELQKQKAREIVEQINNLLANGFDVASEEVQKLYQEWYDVEKQIREEQIKTLEAQKDNYDKAINAVKKVVDEQINALQKQKDALSDENIEGSYGQRIKAINDTINALRKQNEESELANKIEEDRQKLEDLRRQKTRYVFEGGKFIYKVDEEAIKEAQKQLNDDLLQQQINDLENQKDALEEEMKTAQNAIDVQIDALKEYENQWDNVADNFQDAQNRLMAAQLLGANWEADILNQRLDTLNNFANQYIAIQEAIASVTSTPIPSTPSIPSYETGRLGGYTELAITDENGVEMKIRQPSSGIFTLLTTGESVVPSDKTKNLWDWSMYSPKDFINQTSKGSIVHGYTGVSSGESKNYVINLESIVFPNVTNGEEIKRAIYELPNYFKQKGLLYKGGI